MSRSSAAQRPLTFLLTAVLAVLALMVASLAVLPSASATTEDDAVQTSAPVAVEDAAQEEAAAVTEEPETSGPSVEEDAPAGAEVPVVAAALPPAEDFLVETYGPECWDSSWNVEVFYDGEADDLRLVLQEEVAGRWVTLSTQSFWDGHAGVWSTMLEEGETATFRAAVYDRAAPDEVVVLAGPVAVTGVGMDDDCSGWELPELPEEQWTVAEPDCGTITFTSKTDVEVAVLWYGEDDEYDYDAQENYFFLAPGESRTVETSEEWVHWVSAAGVDEELMPIEGEFAYAGDGAVEVTQDCPPAGPTSPTTPGGGHTIPGKVQTDGGADATTVALGLMLMAAAAIGLVRRTV